MFCWMLSESLFNFYVSVHAFVGCLGWGQGENGGRRDRGIANSVMMLTTPRKGYKLLSESPVKIKRQLSNVCVCKFNVVFEMHVFLCCSFCV